MLNTFVLTVNQLIMMFFFMIVGYVMRKREIGGAGVSTVLSTLLVNLFSPALIFLTFSEGFRIKEITENFTFFVAGFLTLAVTFPLAIFLAGRFGKSRLQKDVYT